MTSTIYFSPRQPTAEEREQKRQEERQYELQRVERQLQHEQKKLEKKRNELRQQVQTQEAKLRSKQEESDLARREMERASKRTGRVHDVLDRICDTCHEFPCLLAVVDLNGQRSICSACGVGVQALSESARRTPSSVQSTAAEEVPLPWWGPFDERDGIPPMFRASPKPGTKGGTPTRKEAFASAKALQAHASARVDRCRRNEHDIRLAIETAQQELQQAELRLSQLGTELETHIENMQRRDLEEAERELSEAQRRFSALGGSSRPPTPPRSTARRETSTAPSDCAICMTNTKDTALGCGHTFCSGCLDQVERSSKVCPTCRQPITSRFRIFI